MIVTDLYGCLPKKPKMDTMEVKLQLNQPHVANPTVEPRGLVRYLGIFANIGDTMVAHPMNSPWVVVPNGHQRPHVRRSRPQKIWVPQPVAL